jgi:hypothetical protein
VSSGLVVDDYASIGTTIARVMRVLVENKSYNPNNMTAIDDMSHALEWQFQRILESWLQDNE